MRTTEATLTRQLEAVKTAIKLLAGRRSVAATVATEAATTPTGRKPLSVAARNRIARAQRARWRKFRKAQIAKG